MEGFASGLINMVAGHSFRSDQGVPQVWVYHFGYESS